MLRRTFLAVALVAGCTRALPAQEPQPARAEFDHTHAVWTEILAEHVVDDRFDYAALSKDRSKLDTYLHALAAVTPADHEAWTREQRYAFWINAYNAWTVHLIVKNYPLDSIRDLGTIFNKVWDKRFVAMQNFDLEGKGRKLSLNEVEHEILRPVFEDARVHAAINCASVGCPPLRAEAFRPAVLNEQLEAQVRAWLADTRRNRFDPEKNVIEVSQIFDWFGEDFVRDAGSVEAWIARYAPAEVAKWLTTEGVEPRKRYLDYSWRLNEVVRD